MDGFTLVHAPICVKLLLQQGVTPRAFEARGSLRHGGGEVPLPLRLVLADDCHSSGC